MTIVQRLDALRAERNVLEHPFYRRWSAGELTAAELADYAGQYRHAVFALAEASRGAASCATPEHRPGLERHAAEEAGHVELWTGFQEAAGSSRRADAREQTRDCASAWTAGEDVLEHLAVLYVLESGQVEISRAKLEGLVDHYGYAPEGPATEYFRVHETLDVEHSREAAMLIEELLARDPEPARVQERMLERARAALEGNWRLLDGVQDAFAG